MKQTKYTCDRCIGGSSIFGDVIHRSYSIIDTTANALNILFQSHYFTKEMISGALEWIGGFFKAKDFRSKKD